MSDLQALCEALVALDHDIAMIASRLDAQARQLHAAASRAASVQSEDVQSGLNAERAAVALEQAARATANAARLLNQASLAGQSFVARTVGRSGGGGAPTAGNVSSSEAAPTLEPNPELPAGVGYVSSVGRGLFGAKGVGFHVPVQGPLGNCFFIASLSAVAGCRPDLIRSRVAAAEGNAVDVFGHRISDDLPTGARGDAYGKSSDGSTWVALAEKSYAAAHEGWESLEGGAPASALEWLTGSPALVSLTENLDDSQLRSILGSGLPTVASYRSHSEGEPAHGLAVKYGVTAEGAHAYTFVGLDRNGDVLLRNPWGTEHPRPMPIAVFGELFWRVSQARFPEE